MIKILHIQTLDIAIFYTIFVYKNTISPQIFDFQSVGDSISAIFSRDDNAH